MKLNMITEIEIMIIINNYLYKNNNIDEITFKTVNEILLKKHCRNFIKSSNKSFFYRQCL